MRKSRYDVIIFAALEEEIFFLRRYYEAEVDPLYENVYKAKLEKSGGLRIGMTCIGEMGSIGASIAASEIFERLLPKSTIMVGLAGGYKPKDAKKGLRRGSVGISDEIYYHSYGKLKGEKYKFELRYKKPVGRKYLTESFINQCILKQEWRNMVDEWFQEWKYELSRWKATGKSDSKMPEWLKCVKEDDRDDYLVQKKPQGVTAKEVNMASGEAVIASQKYLDLIRENFPLQNITMFDMESYSIGKIADHYDVPFVTIKGISDYANSGTYEIVSESKVENGEVDQGKTDEYRFYAIAAASAFCIELLKMQFEKVVVDRSNPGKPNSKYIRECMHPEGPLVCPHVENELRKCICPGNLVLPSAVAWLTRVIEGVAPRKYSVNVLQKFPEFAVKGNTAITSFFPYSAIDLIKFIESDTRRVKPAASKLASELLLLSERRRELLSKSKGSEEIVTLESTIVQSIINMKEKLEDRYGHFLMWDTVSKEKGLMNEKCGKLPRLARVIAYDTYEMPEEISIISDPLSSIFPVLLGKNVRTYYTSVGQLNEDSAIPADVTFIDRRCDREGNIDGEMIDFEAYGDCVALRYFAQTRTILVSGIPCKEASELSEKNKNCIEALYMTWKSHWESKPKDIFREFPMDGIVKEQLRKREKQEHV